MDNSFDKDLSAALGENVYDITSRLNTAQFEKDLGFDDLTNEGSGSGLWSSEIQAWMDNVTLKGLFYSDDWVFILCDMLADHISMSPLKVYEKEKVDGKTYIEMVDDHSLEELFAMPNEHQEYESWMYNYVIEQVLMGNTVNYRAKKKNQLMIIPAENVQPILSDDGCVLESYSVYNGAARQCPSQGKTFSAKEVWHQRRPNPCNIYWGLSPFIPNRKAILFNRYTSDYLNSFYLKGATPGMALEMEKNVSEDSAMRFLRTFETAHTGRGNQRRTMMLPKGVKAKILTPSIGDQRLVEMVESNREKILNTLRIPKHALSLAREGSLGSQEQKTALKFFYTTAVLPQQKKIAAFLTRMFRAEGTLKPNEALAFDNSAVEALQEDEKAKAELGQMLKEQWTLNEIRKEVHKKPPIEGGDAFPGTTGNAKEPSTPNSGTTEVPEEIEDQEDVTVEEEDTNDKILRETQAKLISQYFGAYFDLSKKQMERALVNEKDDQVKIWSDVIVEQTKAGVKVVRQELDKLPTKADDDVPRRNPAKAKLRAKLEKELNRGAEVVGSLQADRLARIMEEGYDVALSSITDRDNIREIEALRARDQDGRRRILKERGLLTFANVAETTADKILDAVADGIGKGKTIKEITKAVLDTSKDISKGRASTIAQTEVLTAVSIGKSAAAEDIAKVEPNLMKVWVTQRDPKVRGTPGAPQSKGNHFVLHGAIVPHGEPFDNGLQFPRDPRSKQKEEVINCRCDILFVPASSLASLNIPT